MEPAITSDEKLMFQTDAWWMVSDCPVVRHGDLEPDVDDDAGVLVVWTKGTKGNPNIGYTAQVAISADALRDVLATAGFLPLEPDAGSCSP